MKLPASLLGPRWVMFDGASEANGNKVFGPNGFDLLDSATQNPAYLLSTLRSVSRTVTQVGTENVRGVFTTHYRVEVELTKAGQPTGRDKARLQETQRRLRQLTGKDTIPEDVYIDNDGLTRRFSMSVSSTASHTGGDVAGSMTTTVDFYDFGNADTGAITPPEAERLPGPPVDLLD